MGYVHRYDSSNPTQHLCGIDQFGSSCCAGSNPHVDVTCPKCIELETHKVKVPKDISDKLKQIKQLTIEISKVLENIESLIKS